MRRPWVLACVLLPLACNTPEDRQPTVRAAAPADPWIASADSALSTYLTHQRFGDSRPASMEFPNCDTGGDNATLLVAVGRARIIGHSAPVIDSTPDAGGGPMKTSRYTIELVSVAHFIPTWTLDSSAVPQVQVVNAEPYVVDVGSRVDTAAIIIGQTQAAPSRWSVCDLHHERDAYTPYWDFITQQSGDIAAVQWKPATGSWSGLKQLADSVAAAR